jgi:hypothetical protein
MIGRLSPSLMGLKQEKHREDGQMMLFSYGSLAIRTFRNDPTIRPRTKTQRHQTVTGRYDHHSIPRG